MLYLFNRQKVLYRKDKLPAEMSTDEIDGPELRVHSVIQFCLLDEALRDVANDDSVADLWLKLESMFAKKPVTKLLFETRLHTLRMNEGKPPKDHIDVR